MSGMTLSSIISANYYYYIIMVNEFHAFLLFCFLLFTFRQYSSAILHSNSNRSALTDQTSNTPTHPVEPTNISGDCAKKEYAE